MTALTRIAAVLTAIYKALDAEDIILIGGFLLVAIGTALVVSLGTSMIVIGGLLLYLGLWHRTLIAWAMNNGTTR